MNLEEYKRQWLQRKHQQHEEATHLFNAGLSLDEFAGGEDDE
jgi:hypothetical protein